jgi:hypothetical protein
MQEEMQEETRIMTEELNKQEALQAQHEQTMISSLTNIFNQSVALATQLLDTYINPIETTAV